MLRDVLAIPRHPTLARDALCHLTRYSTSLRSVLNPEPNPNPYPIISPDTQLLPQPSALTLTLTTWYAWQTYAIPFTDSTPVYNAEMWDPETMAFTVRRPPS